MPGPKDDIVAALVARKQPEMRSYTPSWRERFGNWIYDSARKAKFANANRMREEAQMAVDFVPGVGDAIAMNEAARDYEAGNYGMAAAGAGLAAVGMIPGAGDAAAAAGKGLVKKTVGKVAEKAAQKKAAKVTKNAQLTNLRDLPRDEAIAIARKEPHLIKGPDGNYTGAPKHIKDRRSLNKQRKALDAQIERGRRGADWYDRIREGVTEVTGGVRNAEDVMAKEHGMFSAGVSPEGELGYATKALNSTIAYGGVPTKVARPAQQQAGQAAAQNLDPSLFQLGKKTGEYAGKINPAAGARFAGATGVNDFRMFEELGHPDGSVVKGTQPHNWADYETALAADRFGMTGEQVQAAPWVAQKADALLRARNKFYTDRAAQMMRQGDNRSVEEVAWELAFDDARKTAADFFPKHTAYATYENMPLAGSGQLQGLLDAPKAQQDAFAMDPRNSWATAPGGRDALYAGMAHGPVEAGFGMRVRPTAQMQGVWDGPRGTEYNQGFVARPLVGFNTRAKDVKQLPAADRTLLRAAEATRAYMDVQGAGAAHKTFTGGPAGKTTSMYLRKAQPGQASAEEMRRVREIGARYGMPDAVDTGEGVTLTNFMDTPPARRSKQQQALERDLYASGQYNKAYKVNVDGVYESFQDEFAGPQGTGAATKKLLATFDELPEGTRRAMDNNPYLADVAKNKMALYAEAAQQYGIAREDVQNALRIIGQGPGWISRLREGIKSGAILPALGALLLAPAVLEQQSGEPQ